MNKIAILISVLTFNFGFSQVAIGGKENSTNSSVSLEFSDGNRGLILPWTTSESDVTNAVDGTMIFDITDKKVKYKKEGTWFDLSVDTTGTADTTLQDNLTDANEAKVIITSHSATSTDDTAGILVLSDNDKAMILPKVASPHLNIINPAPGMIVYDTTARQLAVFNGNVWSFWKP